MRANHGHAHGLTVVGILALSGLLIAQAAPAQGPGGPPPGGPEGGPPPFGGPPPGGRGGVMRDMPLVHVPVSTLKTFFKLSDKQTLEIDKIVMKSRQGRRMGPPPGGPEGGPEGRGPGGRGAGRNEDLGTPPPSPGEEGARPPDRGDRGRRPEGGRGGNPDGREGGRPGPDGFGPPPGGPDRGPGGGPGMRGPGGPGGPGGPMFEADRKASEQIEKLLTEDQRKSLPALQKAMRTLRENRVPPFVLEKLNLSKEQLDKLAAASGNGRGSKLEGILTKKQMDQIEQMRPEPPGGGPDGPGGPEGRGPGRPGGPDGPGGQRRGGRPGPDGPPPAEGPDAP